MKLAYPVLVLMMASRVSSALAKVHFAYLPCLLAMSWATEAFNRSMDRANTLKTWLPEGYKKQHMWIDRVIYDHALSLVCIHVPVSSQNTGLTHSIFSFVMLRPENSLLRISASVKRNTKRRCGCFMRSRMMSFRQGIHTPNRIARQSPTVCFFILLRSIH